MLELAPVDCEEAVEEAGGAGGVGGITGATEGGAAGAGVADGQDVAIDPSEHI